MAARSKRGERKGWSPVRFLFSAWSSVWRTSVAGLLVWIPLIITVGVTWFFANKFVLGVERVVRVALAPLKDWLASRFVFFSFLSFSDLPFGIGIALVAALFFATGILTRHLVGRRIIALGEKFVKVIPLVNRIYSAVQQIRDVFIGRQGAVFQKVCLVDYPREGMVAVAFVTSMEQGLVQEAVGKQLLAVFVPTTPNPTSGYLVYLPPKEVTFLDISVEEAMKLIISGGAYIPGQAERLIRGNPGDSADEAEPATE